MAPPRLAQRRRLQARRADGRDRYSDDEYEYRHVVLPKTMLKHIPKDYFDPSKGTLKLLWEEEWRGLGITQVCLGHRRPHFVRPG